MIPMARVPRESTPRNRIWPEASLTALVVLAACAFFFLAVESSSLASDSVPGLMSVNTNWEAWEESGVPLGPQNAPAVVSAFMDFTCAHCRDAVFILDSLRALLPDQVKVVFHPFPLYGHHLTIERAIAAECADQQGRFEEMVRVLYGRMETIGEIPWANLANEAGIPDYGAFEECTNQSFRAFPRILASRNLGDSLGVPGTPTLFVNGRSVTDWSLGALLAHIEREALDGRPQR